jgi:RHS repeat-associated protein
METRKTVFQGADTDPATRIILSDAKYSYNLQNRLAKAVIDSDGDGPAAPATVEYGYDAAGIRVKKVEGTDKVLYLVDHHNPTGYAQVLAEIAVAQQVQQLVRLYTLGLDVISQADAAGAVYHLLYDGHGSTRALLNGAGYVIAGQTFAYDAYGNAIGFNPAAALTTFLYSGEQFDQRLQMQYLRARYYDLATGRFNRLDPFFGNLRDPLSLHKSQYAHADPISGIDPRGEFVGSVLGLGLGVMWALSARSKYDASVLSIGSWVGSAVRVLAGYYGTHIAIMSLQAGWTWLRAPVSLTGFHGKIDPNLRWYYVTIVWSRLIQPVAQHYLNGGTAAEYNAGSAGANAIANAYVDYVLQQTDEDSWLAQYLPAWAANFVGGTKCKAWAMGLSTALTGPANTSNGWKVKAHYNSNPFWFDYFLAPNEEAGIHNWFQPAYAHHSFLSLTYHEKPLPNGKVSRPDFVLDPWATRLPDVYDAVNFHKYWPLNQHDPLTGMGNSNIDMGTPSNPT